MHKIFSRICRLLGGIPNAYTGTFAGKRGFADCVHFGMKIIFELKPMNAEGLAAGTSQLVRYANGSKMGDIVWDVILILY
jgi:hypothetical protein